MQIHSPDSLQRVHGLKPPKGPGLFARFIAWHKERVKKAAAVSKALSQYDELLSMPNYMLADIGLTRDMVRQERRRLLLTGKLETTKRRRR